MKKLLSIAIIMSLMVGQSTLCIFGKNEGPIPTIRVQLDPSNLAQQADKNTREIVEKTMIGAAQGLADATKDREFNQQTTEAIKNITQSGTQAFTDAMKDPKLTKQIQEGGAVWARQISAGVKSAQKELESEFYPILKKEYQNIVGSFLNWENAIRFGSPIALFGIISLTGFYGTRVFWSVLEKRLLSPKPAILLPGAKLGRYDRWKLWRAGYKTPPMIFDASIKERLEEIEAKTKNIRDHIRNGEKITYDNLLLYGKPGTGKTLFAQILADKTDMDFLPVTAASLLQAGVEGIKYFDELIDIAKRSKYGVIIFVDEADALFVDRDKLSPESDHYKVLNHILAITGSGSDKFMLIAATNHAYVMDPAMGRRFQDRVLMPLPDKDTRKELLNIYMNEQLFDAKYRSYQFIYAARSLLTTEKIEAIAQTTDGLSHAEIKDMVTIMGKKANATKDGIITRRNVDSAVAEGIEKMNALERDRIELERKTTGQQQQIQPPMIKETSASAA